MSTTAETPVLDYRSLEPDDAAFLRRPKLCSLCGEPGHNSFQCVTGNIPPAMPFGKHKGQRLDSLATDYLVWIATNVGNMRIETRNQIGRELASRGLYRYDPDLNEGSEA